MESALVLVLNFFVMMCLFPLVENYCITGQGPRVRIFIPRKYCKGKKIAILLFANKTKGECDVCNGKIKDILLGECW